MISSSGVLFCAGVDSDLLFLLVGKMRRPATNSTTTINVNAMTRKIDVDNRIPLRNYYRIADNLLKQVFIFSTILRKKEEFFFFLNNKFGLFVNDKVLRRLSLCSFILNLGILLFCSRSLVVGLKVL